MEHNSMNKRTDRLASNGRQYFPDIELGAIKLPSNSFFLNLRSQWSTVDSLVSLFSMLQVSRFPAFLLLSPILLLRVRSGLLLLIVRVVLRWGAEVNYLLPGLWVHSFSPEISGVLWTDIWWYNFKTYWCLNSFLWFDFSISPLHCLFKSSVTKWVREILSVFILVAGRQWNIVSVSN